jgi:hypothetical protein
MTAAARPRGFKFTSSSRDKPLAIVDEHVEAKVPDVEPAGDDGDGTTFLTGVGTEEETVLPREAMERAMVAAGTPASIPARPLDKKKLAKMAVEDAARAAALEGKENVRMLVQKKREMFLVQMRLDVKKKEIIKLEDKARAKEEALKRSQAMLDEDITRFDTFLQANDANALEAMKKAEECAKKRTEVVQQIKMMKQQNAQIQSETSKLREQREEAMRYKKFLEDMTPKEWKEQQLEMRRERRVAKRERWISEQRDGFAAEVQREISAEEQRLVEVLEGLKRKLKRSPNARSQKDIKEEIASLESDFQARKRKLERTIPSRDILELDYRDEDEDEELPLYFQEPQQLIEAFAHIEEQNLFLIQNVQTAEHELEEVESRYKGMISDLQSKVNHMKKAKIDLDKQIKTEEKEIERIKGTFQSKSNIEAQANELKKLDSKVKKVFRTCQSDNTGDPNTLQMLSIIEAKLEELLGYMEEADPDIVTLYERRKEIERRERVKDARKAEMLKKNEDRLKASLLRSQAPVMRKTGKQIMFRSPKQQEKKQVKDNSEEQGMIADHSLFGVHFRDGKSYTELPDTAAGGGGYPPSHSQRVAMKKSDS